MNENKILSFDKKFKALTGWKKFRYVMAIGGFVTTGVFAFLHLGFIEEDATYQTTPFLSHQNLWIVNGIIGLVCGVLFAPKKNIIAALSGLIAAAAITGVTLLYLLPRDTVYMAELVIPLLAGFIGLAVFKSLNRNSDDESPVI
ncbi:MAG: hypothetical protein GQ574_08040 [Crocinitomix sp.]|nr:hypothetical protein [Crocinitomix sp.]